MLFLSRLALIIRQGGISNVNGVCVVSERSLFCWMYVKSQKSDQRVQSEQNEILLADRLLTPSNGLGSGPIRVECCLQFDLNSEGRGLV